MYTLLDLAKANGSDPVVGLIDETTKAHPEITGFANGVQIPGVGLVRTIKGYMYKTLICTARPSVGFRHANEGTDPTKATFENRLVETFIMNPRWNADKAVADMDEDGPEAEIARQAVLHTAAGIQTIAKQFYYGYGTGGDAKGFPGLIHAYDSTNMVVDAGGTTASTGSSVWAVKFGIQEVKWVWGGAGDLRLSDVEIRDVLDANSKPFSAYHQELLGRPGLQVGTTRAVGRIKKLTADSGKGLTDAVIASLLSKFEIGMRPDVLFMSRRSLGQLQASRTATSTTGAPAPFPTESHGVPIAPTDSILDTESLTL